MRAAIVGGAWTMYQYDGNGQRIAKWNVNGTDITIHGPGGLPVRPRGEFGSSIAIVQAELGARRVDRRSFGSRCVATLNSVRTKLIARARE